MVPRHWSIGSRHQLTSSPASGQSVPRLRLCYGWKQRVSAYNTHRLASIASSSGNLSLKDVLVCPNIAKSLLSVSRFTKDNPCGFDFDSDNVRVYDKGTKRVLLMGRNTNGLYNLRSSAVHALFTTRRVAASDEVWHQRLGHPNPLILQHLSSARNIFINKGSMSQCDACKLGKSTRLPFTASTYVATRPLERIHCDLWGPAPVASV